MRYRYKTPDICLCCGRKTKLYLCSIAHIYTEKIEDWIYLCGKCHYLMDSLIDSKVYNGKKIIINKERLFK